MPVEVHPLPFGFVNFLKIKEWGTTEHVLDVGFLTDEQAQAYWQEVSSAWLNHVRKRRTMISDDLKQKAASANDREGQR